MILSDWQIEAHIDEGLIGVDPYDPSLIQPASLDVRLGEDLLLAATQQFTMHNTEPICAVQRNIVFKKRKAADCLIYERNLYLATTLETISFPDNIAGQLMGKSSIGRLGLTIHITAGFLDPGFRGQITLELVNHNPRPIKLTVGMPIAQICFVRLEQPCRHPYAGRYLNQKGVTAPKC